MKRFFLILFTLIFLAKSSLVFAAQKNIPVILDGSEISFDVKPAEVQDRVLVPFRAIAEALNVYVEWNSQEKAVYAKSTDESTKIKLIVNKQSAYVNENPIKLDVPAYEINGRVLVPLRFFSESMGCNVEWDPKFYGVRMTSPLTAMSIIGYYALGSTKASSWEDVFAKPFPETSLGNTKVISDLAFGWYGLDQDGNLLTNNPVSGWKKPSGWEKVMTEAANYNLKTQMTIQVVEDKNQTLTKLLNNQDAMEKAINTIIDEAKMFQAINLDCEQWGNINKVQDLQADQEKFTEFVARLYEQAQANNIKLVLSLHPPNSSYKGYDYTALARVTDQIIIMAYDYRQGPIEPNSQVEAAIQGAIQSVPSKQLLLGINVVNETSKSLAEKIALAKKYNLQGIALWRLGLVSDEKWASIRSSIYALKN